MGIFCINSAAARNYILWGMEADIPPRNVCIVIYSASRRYFELLRKTGKEPVPGKDCFSYNLKEVADSSLKYLLPEALERIRLYDLP